MKNKKHRSKPRRKSKQWIALKLAHRALSQPYHLMSRADATVALAAIQAALTPRKSR